MRLKEYTKDESSLNSLGNETLEILEAIIDVIQTPKVETFNVSNDTLQM